MILLHNSRFQYFIVTSIFYFHVISVILNSNMQFSMVKHDYELLTVSLCIIEGIYIVNLKLHIICDLQNGCDFNSAGKFPRFKVG